MQKTIDNSLQIVYNISYIILRGIKLTSQEERRMFEENIGIIKKLASKYSKAYRQNYDDMYEVGLEFYAWTLKHYDSSKGAKFSTYLYQQVAERMIDEALRNQRQVPFLYGDIKSSIAEDFNFEDTIKAPEEHYMENQQIRNRILTIAKEELSYESYIILQWLFNYGWLEKGKTGPTKTSCRRCLGFSKTAVDVAWQEIDNFWTKLAPKIALEKVA